MTQRLDYTKAAPGGVKAFGSVYGYIMQSGLDATLVDLVYLRVSQINGCAYCLDMHTRELHGRGVPIEKLSSGARELPAAECVPQDAHTTERFDAEGLNRLVK